MENEEITQKLADALVRARENTERPNVFKQMANKAKVIKRLADEYIAMNYVSDAVNQYNRENIPLGAKGFDGTKLDNFYHSRGMYNAAQLGPEAAEYALRLGEEKERFDRIKKKYFQGWSDKKIAADSKKDLQNNINAVIMALNNPGVPVSQVFPYEGTTAGAFDPRFNK
ncbi:MAG: hypothetical protein II238_00590 [Alphaproteobacteria bacterium]|nr:hypothetical protein [Alphaproteobacteria bacterium]